MRTLLAAFLLSACGAEPTKASDSGPGTILDAGVACEADGGACGALYGQCGFLAKASHKANFDDCLDDCSVGCSREFTEDTTPWDTCVGQCRPNCASTIKAWLAKENAKCDASYQACQECRE